MTETITLICDTCGCSFEAEKDSVEDDLYYYCSSDCMQE